LPPGIEVSFPGARNILLPPTGDLTVSDEEEFTLTDEQLKKIRDELSHWQDFLNLTVGVLSFSIAMGIVGLKAKYVWAWLSVGFLLVLVLPQMKKWPPTIVGLKRKKNRTARETILYKGIMEEFFGFKAMLINFSAYWFGVLTLAAVGAGFADFVERVYG